MRNSDPSLCTCAQVPGLSPAGADVLLRVLHHRLPVLPPQVSPQLNGSTVDTAYHCAPVLACEEGIAASCACIKRFCNSWTGDKEEAC